MCPDGWRPKGGPTGGADASIQRGEEVVLDDGSREGTCEQCPRGEVSISGSDSCSVCGDGKFSEEVACLDDGSDGWTINSQNKVFPCTPKTPGAAHCILIVILIERVLIPVTESSTLIPELRIAP